jgi:hypothetical protein
LAQHVTEGPMTHTEIEMIRYRGDGRDWLDWLMLPVEVVGRLLRKARHVHR